VADEADHLWLAGFGTIESWEPTDYVSQLFSQPSIRGIPVKYRTLLTIGVVLSN